MNDHNIDPEEFARHVRDAERMRAEVLRELLFSVRAKLANGAKALARRVAALARRRKWNLSLPAPHH